MKSNIVIDISTLFPYEAKLCFSNHRSKCGWTIKLQVSLKCNISRKKKVMEVIFGMQINIKVFYKLVLSFYVCVVRHAKITQTKKFAYLCSKIRRQWSWFFLPTKSHESFIQDDSITFGCAESYILKVLRKTSLQYLCNI